MAQSRTFLAHKMTIEHVLPTIELRYFLDNSDSQESKDQCKLLADALHRYGAIIIRDPRVTESHNDTFLSQMEQYFSQPHKIKMQDARPEYAYQVGVTPENIETPRCTFDPSCQQLITDLPDHHKPHVPSGPDPKWRFFWRIGTRPTETEFEQLNADPVIPKAFPQWQQVMDTWGNLMAEAVGAVSEMAALGFGLNRSAFRDMTKNGPHLLAPTGSDLSKYGDLDTIFAGFHYDLNFLTIHGKSRFPGLLIWSRNGEKVQVRVPDGCLLVQAGKQMEYLTGGFVMAGYHEVVVLPETLKAVERAKQGNRPLWRISSTLFFHIASDCVLKPLGQFETKETMAKYPPIKTGHQVQRELESINLKH